MLFLGTYTTNIHIRMTQVTSNNYSFEKPDSKAGQSVFPVCVWSVHAMHTSKHCARRWPEHTQGNDNTRLSLEVGLELESNDQLTSNR